MRWRTWMSFSVRCTSNRSNLYLLLQKRMIYDWWFLSLRKGKKYLIILPSTRLIPRNPIYIRKYTNTLPVNSPMPMSSLLNQPAKIKKKPSLSAAWNKSWRARECQWKPSMKTQPRICWRKLSALTKTIFSFRLPAKMSC